MFFLGILGILGFIGIFFTCYTPTTFPFPMVVASSGQFRELTWDDLAPSDEYKKVTKSEILGWIIAALGVVLLFMLMAPVQQLVLTEEQLITIYSRSYAWLNRCDEACEEVVNLGMLHAQRDCSVLIKWFKMERKKDLMPWRLAIDDRATALGCSSFPRSMLMIEQSVRRTDIERRQRIANLQAAKEQELKDELARQLPRYEEALQEGGTLQFTTRRYQDIHNQDIMTITVSDQWYTLSNRLRRQVAEVFWKKWVNIRAPLDPDIPRIRLLNAEGKAIGGSPPDKALPIWVEED